MVRKFEVKNHNFQAWLQHMDRIAAFCDCVGVEADKVQKPLLLQLVIYPEDGRKFPRMAKIPIN